MRTVVTTPEVAHLWANKSQEYARNSGGTVYFSGDTIYSYGAHFPMARHVPEKYQVVLISNRSYSVTTSGHQSATAQACHHLTCYRVNDVLANTKADHKANLQIMREEYEREILTASRARKYGEHHLRSAESMRLTANEYSTLFKLTIRIKPADIESIAKRATQQAKKERTARRKQERKQAKEYAENVILWRQGESGHLRYSYGRAAILRLIQNGEVVETSQGARFPADHARRAIPLVNHCQSKGTPWKQNGERITLGSYRLDQISDKGDVKAGCHRVEFAEVQHLANLLAA
jgi:hypothetical protein